MYRKLKTRDTYDNIDEVIAKSSLNSYLVNLEILTILEPEIYARLERLRAFEERVTVQAVDSDSDPESSSSESECSSPRTESSEVEKEDEDKENVAARLEEEKTDRLNAYEELKTRFNTQLGEANEAYLKEKTEYLFTELDSVENTREKPTDKDYETEKTLIKETLSFLLNLGPQMSICHRLNLLRSTPNFSYDRDEKAIADCEDEETKKAMTKTLEVVKKSRESFIKSDLNTGFECFKDAIEHISKALISNFEMFFSSPKVLADKREATLRKCALDREKALSLSGGTTGAGAGAGSSRSERRRRPVSNRRSMSP